MRDRHGRAGNRERTGTGPVAGRYEELTGEAPETDREALDELARWWPLVTWRSDRGRNHDPRRPGDKGNPIVLPPVE